MAYVGPNHIPYPGFLTTFLGVGEEYLIFTFSLLGYECQQMPEPLLRVWEQGVIIVCQGYYPSAVASSKKKKLKTVQRILWGTELNTY